MPHPIACTLTAADLAARKHDLAAFARDRLLSRAPIPNGERLVFRLSQDTEQRLREAIAAEAACCAFLRFDLRVTGAAIEIDVTGPDEAGPIVAELFAP